ncbi:hypothetical protein [Streptomyces sp. NBC_00439]|uniref:hypothetical protein n=1 Tax=Streptomyces sp. NBC_00439 TaxID=2903650 RepID=UPI00224FB735|nr:hypothetical protein [Streptomyces sp. NBC_00439]MCX5103418.1 hypothetical protein [Streptomyces sp. NBC_00439]
MASKQTDESGDRAVRKTRFVATSSSSTESTDAPEQTELTDGLRTPTLVAGVSMSVAALLCFALSAGLPGGQTTVSDEAVPKVSSLQAQIRTAHAKTAALPKANDAERGLTEALASAGQVATLQNGYRYLTPGVTASGGKLDAAASQSTLRNLIPYFAQSVHQPDLGPWYLLASDKDVAAGIGIPMSFDSGFAWVAQVPYLVNDDNTITATWLAMETRTGPGEKPAVLAWARADYDLVRKTFSDIQTGTTATGEALRQEVKTP